MPKVETPPYTWYKPLVNSSLSGLKISPICVTSEPLHSQPMVLIIATLLENFYEGDFAPSHVSFTDILVKLSLYRECRPITSNGRCVLLAGILRKT